MKTKIQKSVIGGLLGTAVMTLIIFIGPMMGMPKMNPAELLSGTLGLPILVGWIMHFMIGIIFALAYVFVLSGLLKKIDNQVIKGAIFGLIVFLFAQIMIFLMKSMIGGMPAPESNMLLTMLGSIVGHLAYGMVTVGMIHAKS